MSDLFGNHIAGFLMARLELNRLTVFVLESPGFDKDESADRVIIVAMYLFGPQLHLCGSAARATEINAENITPIIIPVSLFL